MIDVPAVLRFLARTMPGLVEALNEAGVCNYAQLMAVATWLLSAAVSGEPDLVDDIEELTGAMQIAYAASLKALERSSPGAMELVREAGSLLVLCPAVPPSEKTTGSVN